MSKANEPAEAQDNAAHIVAHATQRKRWSTPIVIVSDLRGARAGYGIPGTDGTTTTVGGFVYRYGS